MTLEEVTWILKNRLKSRKNYAAQNPLKDVYFKGLQKGALSEVEFLTDLLKLMEEDESGVVR